MTPDTITSAIVAALSAGATTGATDTAKKAIADAYEGFKFLAKKKFGQDSEAAEAIAKLEAKPDSDGRKQTLTEELKAVNATSAPELVYAVQSLLELIRDLPQGTSIAQADRGSTATVAMHHPKEMTDNHHQIAHGTALLRQTVAAQRQSISLVSTRSKSLRYLGQPVQPLRRRSTN